MDGIFPPWSFFSHVDSACASGTLQKAHPRSKHREAGKPCFIIGGTSGLSVKHLRIFRKNKEVSKHKDITASTLNDTVDGSEIRRENHGMVLKPW